MNLTLLENVTYIDLALQLLSAIGCGLLIGAERERSKQRDNPQSFAGLRSFVACSLLGAICFLFGLEVGITGAIIVGGIVISSMRHQTDDLGVTTELAFVLTYFIGALCLWNRPLAAGLAVVLTIILMTKHSMHNFTGKWIKESEFQDGIFLLALVLIALPLTPNTPLWGNVLNPYVILKLLILILGMQALAHIAKRLLSSKNALILSAIASGFVSSTATIASLGMEVRSQRAPAAVNAGAALMSCVATILQLLIIVAGTNPEWLKPIALPSLIAIVILSIGGYIFIHKETFENQNPTADSRMFSLKEAAVIAIALTGIQALVYGLSVWLGEAGLLAGTMLASLFEVHATMATVVLQGPPTDSGIFWAFLLGLGTHAIAKSVNAALTGGRKFALYFVPLQVLHIVVFTLIALI